ncbi:MAG: secondary thiamine-phosphate synthase enzyme YjbQ, partial [Mobilitalea sp.]
MAAIQTFAIRTNQHSEMINITQEIQKIVKDSGVIHGICVIFIPHTTAGITINENADPDVVRDFLMEIDKV